MYKYILRRLLTFIPMLFALTIIVFALIQAAPGDPISGTMFDPKIDPKVFEQQRKELGLDDPLYVQYGRWIGNMLQGDFGQSYVYQGREVTELISSRIGNTFNLGIVTLIVTLAIGIPIGIYSARKPYSFFDYGATTFGFLGLAVPNFFMALLGIYVFSIILGWLPSSGTTSEPGLTGLELFWDKFKHLILPALTLGTAGAAQYMRFTRSEVLDVLGSDYIRTAKAKGMTDRNVLYKHTLRNAMIPIVTLLGFEVGVLLAGAVITESVFQFQGIGTLFISSISSRDYPVIMTLNLMFGFMTLLGNLLADIFYSIVDPRIRYN